MVTCGLASGCGWKNNTCNNICGEKKVEKDCTNGCKWEKWGDVFTCRRE